MTETPILGEDETLALLRAGRTGTEPPLVDLTDRALTGGRRLRTRRRAAWAGAGAVLAAASVVVGMTLPDSGGQAVVQPAIGGPTAGPTGGAEPGASPSPQPGSATNRDYLREILGPGWRLVDVSVETVAGNTVTTGLPAGYRGRASVHVSETAQPVDVLCEPPGEVAGYTCDVKTLTGGRRVAVQTIPFQHFTNDLSVASIAVTYMHDGLAVRVELDALDQAAPAGEPASIAGQLSAWLAGFEDQLTTAATDPRMTEDGSDNGAPGGAAPSH